MTRRAVHAGKPGEAEPHEGTFRVTRRKGRAFPHAIAAAAMGIPLDAALVWERLHALKVFWLRRSLEALCSSLRRKLLNVW